MESNKTSSEFFFYEAALAKKTELFKNCNNIVVGGGNLNADILFVGEAPGRNEDLTGVPFCGAAGKNLDKLLESVGLSRNEIYIANILKCRPPENRDPLPDEIKAHTPWLLKQIKDMKPKVVCSLGNYATKFFLAGGDVDKMNSQPGISQVHGKVREIEIRMSDAPSHIQNKNRLGQTLGCWSSGEGKGEVLKFKLIPLFHPAAIIYNRTKLTPLWEADMEVVKEEIGTEKREVFPELRYPHKYKRKIGWGTLTQNLEGTGDGRQGTGTGDGERGAILRANEMSGLSSQSEAVSVLGGEQ